MISRRIAFITSILATAVSCFTLGVFHARLADGSDGVMGARLDAFREELRLALTRDPSVAMSEGTTGVVGSKSDAGVDQAEGDRARMVSEIKEQLRNEMGLLPVRLFRERRSSFAELYTYDSNGVHTYG